MREEFELKKQYKPNYNGTTKVLAPLTAVEHRLGRFDAINEWQNKEEASKKFLNTRAYRSFINDEYIILIGRTGTGKTSILNKFKYDIENSTRKDINFSYVISLDFKPFLVHLAKLGEIENTVTSLHSLSENIEMLLNLEVMRKIYSDTNFVNLGYSSSNKLYKYLTNNSISIKLDLFTQAIDEMGKLYADTTAGKVFGTLSVLDRLRAKYMTVEYQAIMEDIYDFLKNNRMLILIDSMDRYNIREPEVVLITQTLVEVAFNSFFNKLNKKNILVKIALPAELSTWFIYRLPEKQQQNSVTIEWKYKELICMIAIRWFYYCKYKSNNKMLIELANGWTIDDFYDNYTLAKSFLLKTLPEKCKTNISLSFDTLAYCIRHTQKKPRQLMKIFNVFIDKITSSNDIRYFFNYPHEISECIHSTQTDIISDAVNMYNDYANLRTLEICSDILYKKKFFITKKELMDSIKTIIKNDKYRFKLNINMDEGEWFDILKESGLIGKVNSERYIDKENPYFENTEIMRIIVAVFEYQVKDKLIFNKSDYCILHPMCYEYFENVIDYNTLIYPSPANDDEDLGDISNYLNKQKL